MKRKKKATTRRAIDDQDIEPSDADPRILQTAAEDKVMVGFNVAEIDGVVRALLMKTHSMTKADAAITKKLLKARDLIAR